MSEQKYFKTQNKLYPLVEKLAGSVKLPDPEKDHKELLTDALFVKYQKWKHASIRLF